MAQALRHIYQLKVSLVGMKPPIWRIFLIADSVTLRELHEAIQIVMGWTNTHLYEFVAGRKRYGDLDPDYDEFNTGLIDAGSTKFSAVMRKEKSKIKYEYDFGDGWMHDLVLEKKLKFETDQQLPYCLTGRRGCPPEDVGGVWGYQEFLAIYQDEQHPEHNEMVEWAGDYFHPENLDLEEINEILRETFQ
ncbi:MAG: plasmid pRiA4b ORF-3 family protein [Desulfobulbaceae bacterium]|nr:plasmid pRiA4b ORF-3 family protein [Desulfobulbaceae bacterium]